VIRARIIPCLLLRDRGLVKTRRFRDDRYVGDPINAVKIFNDKFVDELILLDIDASRDGRGPDFDHLKKITSECFIPFCYGGGVRHLEDARRLFSIGVEKVCVNTAAIHRPELVRELAEEFGSQSIVVALDVKQGFFGSRRVMLNNGTRKTGLDPLRYSEQVVGLGAGELLINSVDRDGEMEGYDLPLLTEVVCRVRVPVVACGGAGSLHHMKAAVEAAGVSAAAAGSLFVFKGAHRAVLINYPDPQTLREAFPLHAGS